jgi:adenylate cyclase
MRTDDEASLDGPVTDPDPGAPDAPVPEDVADDAAMTTMWRDLLTGVDSRLLKIRRIWKHVPAAPRCKVCASPFHGIGGAVARLAWHGPIPNNPLLCKACFGSLATRVGGAEIEISVMFADIRGSTGLAERIGAGAFRRLVQDYYRVASGAIEMNDGIVDKFLGDGVMALFVPVIAGELHSARAIAAGRDLLARVRRGGLGRTGVMVGAGVHSGEAFVGVVGGDEKVDFTALGDTVNVAARLGQLAGPGELLVSRVAWDRAGLGSPPDVRDVDIAGREGKLPVVAVQEVAGSAA